MTVGVVETEVRRTGLVGVEILVDDDRGVEQPLPDLADVGEVVGTRHVLRQTGVEREHRLGELHALEREQADRGLTTAQDLVARLLVAAHHLEPEGLVVRARPVEIGHGNADRKGSELHSQDRSFAPCGTLPVMGYHLGVDLGTTFTAAAVHHDGVVEMVNLGTAAAATPSVIALESGVFTAGEAAEARSLADPSLAAREFKRRIGDPAPILIGGSPYAPHLLMARLLEEVVEVVVERQGEQPDGVTLTHPANWGGYRRELFEAATRSVLDPVPVTFITEPEAAAIDYASRQRLPVGQAVAVYDLGGGTFDAAVLRRDDNGFSVLGTPRGVEHLGGIDFDAAVLQHVIEEAGISDVDPDDPTTAAALQQLRRACVDAKVALSSTTDATIPVFVPGATGPVRLTRAEFEEMVGPLLDESVKALTRAITGTDLEPSDITSILLVGGSSRIPLVAQRVTSALGRPVAVDADPKNAIARGAARSGEGLADQPASDGSVGAGTSAATAAAVGAGAAVSSATVSDSAALPTPASASDTDDAAEHRTEGDAPAEKDEHEKKPRNPVPFVLAGAGAVLALVLFALVPRGDDGEPVLETADQAPVDPIESTATPVLGTGAAPSCTSPNADGVFRIGVATDVTGPLRFLTGVESGARLAVDDLNTAGGVNGEPVELIVADTAGGAAGAVAELGSAGADVMVGPLSTGESQQAIPALQSSCLLGLTTSASSVGLRSINDDDLFFQSAATTEHVAAAAVDLAVAQGASRVMVVGPGIAVSDSDAEREVQDTVEAAGLEFVTEPSVAAARPGPDDFVLLTGDVDPAANAADLEQLIANGAAPDRVVLVGLNLDDVVENLEAPIDGVRAVTPFAPPVESLAARLGQNDVSSPLGTDQDYVPETYDAVTFLALAATAADSDATADVARFLPDVSQSEIGTACADFAGCVLILEGGDTPILAAQTVPPTFDGRGVATDATVSIDVIEGGVVVSSPADTTTDR